MKKYPRTYHLPWSKGISNDDKVISSLECFYDKEIVVTEKMDGENTTLYSGNRMHARSLDSKHNYTRDYAKKFLSNITNDIPEEYRFVFENVHYKHSIYYDNLSTYMYLISIWHNDTCISFDDMMVWAELMDLKIPSIFYRGKFNEEILRNISNNLDTNKIEGYVIRNTNSFLYDDFNKNVAKFVRKDHVNTSKNWINETYPNKMKGAS